jgi:periplasmic copper chaperone A
VIIEMSSFVRSLLFVAAVATAAGAEAQVTVSGAWVRGTVPGQTATGAYMQLKSADGATVVGAESLAAGIVEIHEMRMEGNTMRMRGVEQLELPAGRAVELKPGGYHVMLMDLKTPLKKGETVPITLKVRSKSGQTQDVLVKAEVRDVAAGGQSKR